jgi:hypothetical protein
MTVLLLKEQFSVREELERAGAGRAHEDLADLLRHTDGVGGRHLAPLWEKPGPPVFFTPPWDVGPGEPTSVAACYRILVQQRRGQTALTFSASPLSPGPF